MRWLRHTPILLALLLMPALTGCSFIAAILGMEESQRDWAGNPADGNERHSAESMQHNAELDRIYN